MSHAVPFEEVDGETEVASPEVYTSNLIEWAVERHCSDLFVSDGVDVVTVSVRRMGRIEPVRRLSRGYGRKLQGHLRVLAGSDVGEMLRPTDGRGAIRTPDGSLVDLRLSTLPTLHGQDVAIRLFDPVRGARSIDALGFEAAELDTLDKLIHKASGLILVAGPVGSGKTSTMYAAVEALNDGQHKIHTLEDPIEHVLPGVMQSQVNSKLGLDFADLLVTVLRHSPDVIMIGEIRDSETATTAVRAGASGTLVMATVHAKSSAEAIDTMRQYGSQAKFLASALIGVVNQRLVRHLCEKCRKPVEPCELEINDRVRAAIGDEPIGQFQAVGCEACHQTGYDRLINVPEIMLVDGPLTESISERRSAGEIERQAIDAGMLPLADVAMLRVIRGETTIEEARRVEPTL